MFGLYNIKIRGPSGLLFIYSNTPALLHNIEIYYKIPMNRTAPMGVFYFNIYIKCMANNNALSKEEIEEIKDDLLKRKDQILKDLKNIGEKEANGSEGDFKTSFPEYGDKDDENAQEINEYSTNLATEQVLEKTIKDINVALDRIKDGTYGVCKYCGDDIGKMRMQARPVASSCIECKTKIQESN